VHGKDLFVNDGGDGQAVEAVGKRLPQLDVISPLACISATVLLYLLPNQHHSACTHSKLVTSLSATQKLIVKTHTRHRTRKSC
jgi:hypothetical protein